MNGQAKENEQAKQDKDEPVRARSRVETRAPEDAFEFDVIAENIFRPIYPVIAGDIVEKTGKSAGTFLDIGCGGGHLGLALLEKTALDGHFLDIDAAALQLAEERAASRGSLARAFPLSGYPSDGFPPTLYST